VSSFQLRRGSPFFSDPGEFFWVDNDANRLDLSLHYLNGQDGEGFFASADDHGWLPVDFLYGAPLEQVQRRVVPTPREPAQMP
jgi:hypothetical protein